MYLLIIYAMSFLFCRWIMDVINWVLWLDIYIFFAIGYNLCSQLLLDFRGKTLAPTDPTTGVLIMVSLYLWFRLAPNLSILLFVFIALVFIYLVCRFGIYRHVVSFKESEYSSRFSWGTAILINICGVVVLAGYLVTQI